VLKLRFGLDDDRPRTLREIGDQLNLTRERIRQIEQKAMRKLGRSKKLQQLRGYLN
jgi:RNA polymerase primary sigma factor